MRGRRARILVEVVDRYIRTHQPVSSQDLVRAYHHRLSSATIRNELHALEEEGYLYKPHPSSGRVPTVQGFRFFAQWLLAMVQDASPLPSLPVEPQPAPGLPPLPDLLRRTAFLLAGLTGGLGFVVPPRPEAFRCAGVVLREIRPGALLAATISESGLVETRILLCPPDLGPEDLRDAEQWLVQQLRGNLNEDTLLGPWEGRAVQLAHRLLRELREVPPLSCLLAEGWPQFLSELAVHSPGWALKKIQAILQLLQDEPGFLELLRDLRHGESGLMAHVGIEQIPELEDLSLVTASYFTDREILGVAGPLWMDYARTFAAVRYLASRLQSFLR